MKKKNENDFEYEPEFEEDFEYEPKYEDDLDFEYDFTYDPEEKFWDDLL